MASYQVRQRDPLLDRNMQAMIERRGKELLGVLLIALALAVAVMLGSYAPDDPGWMVATDEPAQNAMGRFGAAVSSTLIIIAGLGAWGLPVVLAAWGLRFMLHLGEDRAIGRLIFALIAIALASVYAATHVPGADWGHSFGLGGLFGDTVLGALLGVAPVQATVGLKILSLLIALALVAMGLFVTGFDMPELRAVGRFLLVGLVMTYAGAVMLTRQGLGLALRTGSAVRSQASARAGDWRAARAERAAAAPVPAPAAAARVRRAAAAEEPAPVVADSVTRAVQARVARAAEPAQFQAPQPLNADPRAAPRPLRADPRPQAAAPAPEPSAPVRSLLAMVPGLMKRTPEPEPELVEPPPLDPHRYSDLPSEDRIRARISDVIRARVRRAPVPVVTAPPVDAAARAEPPMFRPRKPMPLILDTQRRPAAPALPPEPPVTAAPLTAAPAAAAFVAAAPRAAVAMPEADPLPREYLDPAPHTAGAGPAWDEDLVEDDLGFEDMEDVDDTWSVPEPLHAAPPLRAPISPAAPAPRLTVPVPEPRRIVQPAVKRTIPESRQARAEAQPRLKFEDHFPEYEAPPLSLLTNPTSIIRHHLSDEALEENARLLENVLDDYGVKGEIVSVRPGPVVTMYELEPAPGLKASRVIGLADDIARSMSALSARVSTVPGRSVIGIELPNAHREKVVLREILSARDFGDSNMRLPLALGKDIGGDPIVANLAKMPHLLIAGTTGSGKSVAINTMILSLLYKLTPEECRLIMIDPKMLELSVYDGIPHLLSPVVTDPKKAVVALKWVVGEMEERYRKMSKMGVRNIEGYNGRVREALDRGEMFKRTVQTGFDEDTGDPIFETDEFAPVALPYIVVIVDEMADLMMVAGKEIEACIQRLAQMARASGIHLIMATQRPSVDVITGTIKANFPTRISFQVTSKIDSRTILGEQGAEQLLGMGDMLYMAGGGRISRIHGPFVSDEEVEEVVTHLKSFGPPQYMSGVVEGPDEDSASDIDAVLGLGGGENSEDALYDQAVAIVARDRKCSTSYIQRKLGIGYQKAARLVEQMEDQGVVTPANHVGKREILLPEQ
ncbi:DNA translocase FtsK [Ruixingdingia sedimenti]|uniref:DNA translocase FtsK n=1 Tax=Ruixingdingia sedimenti TaxID=3073604 RepID=A0ABU1F6F5_9RHOB|nr:DNA translocase FtsK 4TM domain-containing protein [Xinfangfangia sp. LG-4]MDR5652409.1 DNA translocase FtsK 4TM domain-containing protein [Xinfangfangia sp. LG-4]